MTVVENALTLEIVSSLGQISKPKSVWRTNPTLGHHDGAMAPFLGKTEKLLTPILDLKEISTYLMQDPQIASGVEALLILVRTNK